MRRLPPLHSLRAFEAAARHLHFADAAEELGLTPTAISHQVRQLEKILNVELFHRYPRPVRLTREGEKLFPVVRDSLDRMAVTIQNLGPVRPEGPLRISMTMAFASRWFLSRLPYLRDQLQMNVAIEADDRIVELRSAEIDIAIRCAGYPSGNEEWQLLFTDEIIAVCAPALLSHKPPLTPQQVLELPLLHYRWKSGSLNGPSWPKWLASSGIKQKLPQSVQLFSEEIHAIEAAANGQGAILASQRLISDLLRNGTLVRISDTALPAPSFWAVHLPDHPRNKAIQRLIEWLRQI